MKFAHGKARVRRDDARPFLPARGPTGIRGVMTLMAGDHLDTQRQLATGA